MTKEEIILKNCVYRKSQIETDIEDISAAMQEYADQEVAAYKETLADELVSLQAQLFECENNPNYKRS